MGMFGGIKRAYKRIKRKINKNTKSLQSVTKTLLGISMVEQAEKANEEAKKAREQAKEIYDAEIVRAQEAADLIKNEELERKKRIALKGTRKPSTLLGSYLGQPTKLG